MKRSIIESYNSNHACEEGDKRDRCNSRRVVLLLWHHVRILNIYASSYIIVWIVLGPFALVEQSCVKNKLLFVRVLFDLLMLRL